MLESTDPTPYCVVGREIAGDWGLCSHREWLVTNGIGGYAAGTVAGANTRRYHGVLVASLAPPVQRVVLVSKLELSVSYLGQQYDLSSNEYEDGTVNPKGFTHIESFRIEGGIPIWRFALADALLEQSVFMPEGSNTTFVRLRVLRSTAPLHCSVLPLCTYRDYHGSSRGAHPYTVQNKQSGCVLQAFEGARSLHLNLSGGLFEPGEDWYWRIFHRRELERGLDATEDLFKPGTFSAILEQSQESHFTATIEPPESLPQASTVVASLRKKCDQLVAALPSDSPNWIRQLALASDQFVVKRGADGQGGVSIIAGYPWFADWGRDTMISLPGLTSILSRHDIAGSVLRTFAKFVDRGMLPNRFPDQGEAPEYNTVDATLWYFQAIHEAMAASGDLSLARDLYPTLIEIIRAHVAGTRYGIQVDTDALLRAGEPGVQLTWMDAKVGDWVVTPRIGKAVEVNALWLNALSITREMAKSQRDAAGRKLCDDLLARGAKSFGKFWNPDTECLYDVIDTGASNSFDATLRPNQILAVALPYSALSVEQMRKRGHCLWPRISDKRGHAHTKPPE